KWRHSCMAKTESEATGFFGRDPPRGALLPVTHEERRVEQHAQPCVAHGVVGQTEWVDADPLSPADPLACLPPVRPQVDFRPPVELGPEAGTPAGREPDLLHLEVKGDDPAGPRKDLPRAAPRVGPAGVDREAGTALRPALQAEKPGDHRMRAVHPGRVAV